MEQSKNLADRVRPILQAMERSIDAARRQRITGPDGLRLQQSPTPAEPRIPQSQPVQDESDSPQEEPQRLRARPKRATPMNPLSRDLNIRSRAS